MELRKLGLEFGTKRFYWKSELGGFLAFHKKNTIANRTSACSRFRCDYHVGFTLKFVSFDLNFPLQASVIRYTKRIAVE